MSKSILFGVSLMLVALNANGASFDCKRATTDVEKTICTDARLSQLDDEMGAAYSAATAVAADRKALKRKQKQWLRVRDSKCGTDTGCLRDLYEANIVDLRFEALYPRKDKRQAGTPTVTEGADRRVCQQYLRALKWYGVIMTNGPTGTLTDPEWYEAEINPSVKGFGALRRVLLDAEHVAQIYPQLHAMESDGDPEIANRPGVPYYFGEMTDEQRIDRATSELAMHRWAVWRFEPEIDMDNDGKADPILLWRERYCSNRNLYCSVQTMVFDESYSELAAERTRLLIGDSRPGFRPYMSIDGGRNFPFLFESRYYLASWFAVDYWDPEQPVHQRSRVYLWENGSRSRVCEVLWRRDIA